MIFLMMVNDLQSDRNLKDPKLKETKQELIQNN